MKLFIIYKINYFIYITYFVFKIYWGLGIGDWGFGFGGGGPNPPPPPPNPTPPQKKK